MNRVLNVVYLSLSLFSSLPLSSFLSLSLSLRGGATPEQVGVALGFVAQLVHYLAKFLLIPLEYPIKPYGSRSSITDSVHEEGSVERE